ncbi:hypothetical protein SKAU_G00206150 [Synaphobranchus kaupii]|uniref:TCDD-inducible poly [ADP-ribose] polymerase n=1 Tax=Synaphobranchus kaupii TaxID=118154 RepID=A0A9Q1IYA9_SYNKA|nr:hypothetical protein SKAU_G00206150 [Synaphobranchus kaupii]
MSQSRYRHADRGPKPELCLNGGSLGTNEPLIGTKIKRGYWRQRNAYEETESGTENPVRFRTGLRRTPSSIVMETTPCPLTKSADAAGKIHEEPSPGAGAGDFAEPVGLSDRIPLVKPCFKKKDAQRNLEPKCLQALDPILTSLLASDTLVAGEGVFVSPKSLRAHRHLCSSAAPKQAWRKRACPRDQSTAPGILPGNVHGESAGIPHPPDPSEGEREPPDVSRPPLPAATVEQSILPQGGKAGDSTPSGCLGDGIFRGKSEEASLDLVFDFLTQLQYHTHRDQGVAVCVDFLRGACAYGSDCAFHHTVLPYHWQIRRAEGGAWRSLSDDSQDQLERLYCNPDNESVRLKHQGRVFTLDLCTMRVQDLEFDQYFCKDNLGWREYSKLVVRLIEEASGHGLKEVRFVTLQNQYVLNIGEGFQQNAVFGFRRPIRKRPVFLSSVLLTPYLQTLGGLSSSESPSRSRPPSPTATAPPAPLALPTPLALPALPTTPAPARLFPETWLPMGPCQDFLQVPVAPEDRSYRTVYSLFHRTVSETRFRIVRILRVQNSFLWEKYKRKKEYMSRKMSESERGQNERHLFHGTSQDAVDGICKHNFDPRVCGKHATMFGQGSYFARKAVYSHNFSKCSPKGVHFMFLAKVLTGRVTMGNPCMRRPPPLCPSDPSSDLFDSCVDNWVDPQVFVIFNDDQSYPYFIIEYEEVSSTVSI